MTSQRITPGQHIHLVGIGGSGLSAIARILLGQGYRVSGSDKGANDQTTALAAEGVTVYAGHDAAHIQGADALLISSAVPADHVEVAAAKAANIPVYKRQDIMADLMRGQRVIAVAGTKGKTTTTSMIVHTLRECGANPSYIVGGVLGNTGTNAGVGQGKLFVVEADEYDNMFLGLKPNVIILTNIEYDHPDFFKSPAEMVDSFRRFLRLLPADGDHMLTACGDDATVRRLSEEIYASYNNTGLYGLNRPVDICADNVHMNSEGQTCFDVVSVKHGGSDDLRMATVCLSVPGRHNVQNALAAFITTFEATGAQPEQIAAALGSFKSTARRFEVRADQHRIAVVDDYAHNPMSIRAAIDAAHLRYPDRDIWAVWQPHTYSRTQALMSEFLTVFDQADHVLITDIYAARETPIEGVSSAAMIAAISHADAHHTPAFQDAVAILDSQVQAPAVILIMSAGDAPAIGIEFLKRRQEGNDRLQP